MRPDERSAASNPCVTANRNSATPVCKPERSGREARATLGHDALLNWRRLLGGGHKTSTLREPSSAAQVRAAGSPDRHGRRRQFVLRRTTVDMLATDTPESRSGVAGPGGASIA